MKTNKFFGKKKPGQAMVEFALALPVLLLLLYGILEAGRFLFLYSTVVTASRQAARYGTTTGDGGGPNPVYGAPRSVVPRYDDCAGIRGAGNAVAYITRGGFNIQLGWDKGPADPLPDRAMCLTGAPDETSSTPAIPDISANSTRLVVTVSTEFVPIVPKLVPFIRRTITATSARTILYSVPIVVPQEQQPNFSKNTTSLTITDDPDPSEPGAPVTVTVHVTGSNPAPTGIVQISGGDQTTTCSDQTLPADNSGIVSCTITFDTAGLKTITAFYLGDENNEATSAVADHTVQAVFPTAIQITLDDPDPTIKNQLFAVAVKVTTIGSTSTPTGTVTVSGGGNVTCSIPLTLGSMGLGSCALSFNNLGSKTLTATYSGDSTHLSSTVTEPHEVLNGTPTPTASPTITPIPSATPIPTATATKTAIPSPVPACNGITTPGGITFSGNIMSITINNPYGFDLTMNDITVTWNNDKGHKTGSDKTLNLQKIMVGPTTVWTGTTSNQATLSVLTTATVSPGPSVTTVSFYFDQSYDNSDGTENVLIHWLTPGCQNNPIDVH